jgi:Ohr subfamily peroxiredoxin
MAIEKVLYTAQATATGGRDGKAVSSDGNLSVGLSVPKGLGGPGGAGTNPEQLFAAGYAACFIGAMKFVAGQKKVALPAETSITSEVGIGPIPTGWTPPWPTTWCRPRTSCVPTPTPHAATST